MIVWNTLFGSPFRDHNFVQFHRRAGVETLPVLSTGVSTVATRHPRGDGDREIVAQDQARVAEAAVVATTVA